VGPLEEAIVTDDRSDPETAAPQSSSRKPRPPVIELKATDVTPETPADAGTAEASAQREETAEQSHIAASDSSASGGSQSHTVAIFTGVIGVLAGALVLALVFLLAGDRIRQLSSSSPEIAAGPPASEGTAVLADRIAQLQKSTADYEKRLAVVEERKPPNVDLAPLTARLDSVEKTLSDLRLLIQQTESSASAAREALSGRVAALENSLKKSADSAAANSAEIVALGVLHDAIVKGAPFAKELRIVRTMLGDRSASLAPLEQSAEKGLPTVAVLRAQFAALAPKLVHQSEAGAGYFSRLISSASRLVEVRPVGDVPGASAGAVTARIETRLAHNDLSAALDEAAQLPASAKATAAEWMAAATRRRDAERTVNTILNATLASSTAEPKQ
jgi:hypothetical protein